MDELIDLLPPRRLVNMKETEMLSRAPRAANLKNLLCEGETLESGERPPG